MSDKQGKFNIKALRQQAEQTSQPDDQTPSQPDNRKPVKPDSHMSGQPDERRVNLCVKVPETWRKNWANQAKIQDVTMTQVMVDALTDKFGLPDDQMTR
mgnify:CR=1 FL=1